MGEPQRSDAVESDRRSSPRFPAELLGKASVRLLGGSEVTLINFSERGILFQSETRLLVGARGTVRIVVGSETTIAAGTVVRSLVQGMASGKLAFHTALHLDQPLALAAVVEARERARLAEEAAVLPPVGDEPEPIAEEPEALAAPPAPEPVIERPPVIGKTIEKRSRRRAEPVEPIVEAPAGPEPAREAFEGVAFEAEAAEPIAFEAEAVEPSAAARPVVVPAPPATTVGFTAGAFEDAGGFGWSDPVATAAPGLSVLFVSTTKDRTARLQAMLSSHRRDIVLTSIVHARAEAIADLARQHDVLLFDYAIGPDTLERTLGALRQSPLGASIAIYVPQQAALPPSVSGLANACVVDSASGDLLVSALRDAAWTPWQPVEPQEAADAHRDGPFWKALDALPVPVLVVDADGAIVHTNGACAILADTSDLAARPLASLFAEVDAPAIARLVAGGFAGGAEETSVITAPADAATIQLRLQALTVLPGPSGRQELAIVCERRAEPTAVETAPVAGAAGDLAAEIAARAGLAQELEAARGELALLGDEAASLRAELTQLRGELERSRDDAGAAIRERDAAVHERDELRGRLEGAGTDVEQARERERTAEARIAELERVASDAARFEVAAARAQSQLAATTEELSALRHELDASRMRATSDGVDAQRTAARHAALEDSARQAIDELKIARADAQRLTRERDQALAAADAERARADAALAAVRDDAKKRRKIVGDDAVALATAKLQRQIDDLRAQVSHEQDARRELEELLDENAANLEKTIQDYEERIEALSAGVEDARATRPKKTRQG